MFDFPHGFFDEDRRDELFFFVAREFQDVTEDPRPFDRLIEYAGPSITFRQTLDPAWRAQANAVLHPGCQKNTIQRNFLGPLRSLDKYLTKTRREKGCDTRRMFWLTPEQAEDLLRVASTPERYGVDDPQRRIRTAIAFLLGTGCRTGESFVLAAEDINWNTRECLVRGELEGAGKTEASTRLVYLPSKATDHMEGLPDKGPIILNRKGKRFTLRYKGGGQIRREFKKLREAADLPKECTPHSLRHSFATWTYAATKDMKLLMSRGGWAKHDTALRYTKLAPSDLPMRLKSYGWDFGNDLDN